MRRIAILLVSQLKRFYHSACNIVFISSPPDECRHMTLFSYTTMSFRHLAIITTRCS
jgi:hypothetical protein